MREYSVPEAFVYSWSNSWTACFRLIRKVLSLEAGEEYAGEELQILPALQALYPSSSIECSGIWLLIRNVAARSK